MSLNSLTKKLKPGVYLPVSARPLTPVLANKKNGLASGVAVNTSFRPFAKPVSSCVSVTSLRANCVASSMMLPLESNTCE